jgi:hypothetical protein
MPPSGSLFIDSRVAVPGPLGAKWRNRLGQVGGRELQCIVGPTSPATVRLGKFTTPPDALTCRCPPSAPADPKVCSATVTGAVEPVAEFPAESRTARTGGVASTAPETPAIGWVVIVSCVAAQARSG